MEKLNFDWQFIWNIGAYGMMVGIGIAAFFGIIWLIAQIVIDGF